MRASQGDVYAGMEDEARMAEFQVIIRFTWATTHDEMIAGWTEQRTNWFNMLQQIFVSGEDVQTAADNLVEASNAAN